MAPRFSQRSTVVPRRRASRAASRAQRPRRAFLTALLVFTCAAAGYGVWRTTTEPVRPAAHRSGLAPAPDVTSPGPPAPSPIAVTERGGGTLPTAGHSGR